jgi:hypothetical protein
MATRSVFISYAHADSQVVLPDVELLRAGGVRVFMDVRDIDYGERWATALKRALDGCERVIVFWSAAAKVSDWVEREWRMAVERGKKIVPTLLDDTPLPRELAGLQALKRHPLQIVPSRTSARIGPSAGPFASASRPRNRPGLALLAGSTLVVLVGGGALWWMSRADEAARRIPSYAPSAPASAPSVPPPIDVSTTFFSVVDRFLFFWQAVVIAVGIVSIWILVRRERTSRRAAGPARTLVEAIFAA